MVKSKTIDSLLEIADQFDAFFIDMFGVLWDGEAFYPEALSICAKLIQNKKKIYVLTNTTVLKDDVKQKYKKFGFLSRVHYTDIITSGDILKFELENHALMDKVTKKKGGKYFLIGLPNDKVLKSVLSRQTDDISKASVVYLSASQKIKNNKYIKLKSMRSFIPDLKKTLQYNLPVLCANPDYFSIERGCKCITQGSLAQWYEKHGGRVYWIGKPYPQIYNYAIQKTKLIPQRCAMIGDTIRTDILGGKNAGMKTILIIGYGVTHDRLQRGESLDQIAKQEKAFPDFLLPILR